MLLNNKEWCAKFFFVRCRSKEVSNHNGKHAVWPSILSFICPTGDHEFLSLEYSAIDNIVGLVFESTIFLLRGNKHIKSCIKVTKKITHYIFHDLSAERISIFRTTSAGIIEIYMKYMAANSSQSHFTCVSIFIRIFHSRQPYVPKPMLEHGKSNENKTITKVI